MAERVYAAVGFRDLGRILEYVPAPSARHLGDGACDERVADALAPSELVEASFRMPTAQGWSSSQTAPR